jgi:hypothetical protein
VLGLALALPAFAQTATDQTPANPSSIKDGTPAAGTGSGAAPGNDPVASGKTGATLGSQAPQQDPGPMGATTNPAPADSSGTGMSSPGSTATPSTSTQGMSSGGNASDQSTSETPARPRHRSMSSNAGSSGHWAHQPGTGESGPASSQASNIDSADTHSAIAPHLPSPDVGENANPDRYLHVAERAIRAHKTGEAQQALEMAETRLLDRSTAPNAASQPDQNPRIAAVTAARKALASKDWASARKSIQEAMNGSGEGGMGGGAMSGEGGMAPSGGASSGQMQNGMNSTSTSTGVGSQGVASGNPGASPAPMDPSATGAGATGAAGAQAPGTPAMQNPSNPGNGAK